MHPFSAIHQAWKDYKAGRALRKNTNTNAEKQPKPTERKRRGYSPWLVRPSPKLSIKLLPAPARMAVAQTRWKFDRTAEYPWRLERVVDAESNWRGTWVLEAKDMQAMVWETIRVPKERPGRGRGGNCQRTPTRQLLFMPERLQGGDLGGGGQDDMMVWLGKR
ncbi:hypothetical protein B0T24DRAFT_690389 [Lasiosphaeria ovina]|uniref:Uncharacterized protein n=1 Tax=Lasiosphaeria ovina TaxID=92902 RepID=A0AAE0JU96_9PEZI|nr:hypothetical protein B0T24DRAFT_690389 [Lasiosphaeria ovina]